MRAFFISALCAALSLSCAATVPAAAPSVPMAAVAWSMTVESDKIMRSYTVVPEGRGLPVPGQNVWTCSQRPIRRNTIEEGHISESVMVYCEDGRTRVGFIIMCDETHREQATYVGLTFEGHEHVIGLHCRDASLEMAKQK